MSSLVLTLPSGAYISSRGPAYDVRIDTAQSGKEWRFAWASVPRHHIGVTVDVLRSDTGSRVDAQVLWAFLSRHFGSLDSFLFTDPDDSTVTAHPFGVGDGATVAFQLQRTQAVGLSSPSYWPAYASGYEPVFDLNAAPSIYINGVLKTLTTDYTVSATGLVTFTSAPAGAAVLTWSGSYYQRVRLDGGVAYQRVIGGMWSASFSLISVLP